MQGEGRDERDRPSSSALMDEREIAAVEFEEAHAAEMRQAVRVAELEGQVTSTRSKVGILITLDPVSRLLAIAAPQIHLIR